MDHTLRNYVLLKPELTPVSPPGWIARSRIFLRIKAKTAGSYWKTERPTTYLRALCSMLTSHLEHRPDLVIHPDAKISCMYPSLEITTLTFQQVINQLVMDSTIRSIMQTSNKVYEWRSWAMDNNAMSHLLGHICLIWTLTQALDEPKFVVKDEITKENVSAIKACIPSWTLYLESLIQACLHR